MAVKNGSIEIVKHLLNNNKLDVNLGYIFNNFFYKILYHIFQWHSKSHLSMRF